MFVHKSSNVEFISDEDLLSNLDRISKLIPHNTHLEDEVSYY
jgi:hypothetical protein